MKITQLFFLIHNHLLGQKFQQQNNLNYKLSMMREEWKRNRQAEYPSHEDCIHALLDGGETLENLQSVRQAVKR